ncbi:MAG: PKD domain-containing protein [Muribaculaceae bacterium]
MKLIKNIGFLAVMMLAMVACVDKTPDYGNFPTKDVDFTYAVDGDQYKLDFYVVSTFKFTNTSSKSGAATWDFGDGTTSIEVNPVHKYAKSGNYKVTLEVDGVGKVTYPILVYDIVPILSVKTQSADTLVINDVLVDLDIFLPNPEKLKTKYIWTFPDGTTKEDGTPITEFIGYSHEDGTKDNPGKLKFKNIGSQKIELKTIFDIDREGGENRQLEDSYINVQVGYNKPCPTIYYASMGGNIMAYKIIDPTTLPKGTKNLAFDLGVSSGTMPTQLVFKTVKTKVDGEADKEEDLLYILDCGKQYIYINDEDNKNGDGQITVMTADGKSSNVVVTNVGGQALDDPFQGCADDEYLYYTDRNMGVRKIKLTARGEKEVLCNSNYAQDNYIVKNDWLIAYYNKAYAYGAIHTGIVLDSKGMFWWCKNYSGNGIVRFKKSDVNQPASKLYPEVLDGANPRAFNIDEKRKAMYVWMSKGTPGAGFCEYPLPEETTDIKDMPKLDSPVKYIEMDADPVNKTPEEGVFVTQFAVDNISGNVYFGFNKSLTEKKYTTGLYYYDISTKKVVNYANNTDKILGVAINPRPTRLF